MSSKKPEITIEKCGQGHKYPRYDDHPKNASGFYRCPHCMGNVTDALVQTAERGEVARQKLVDKFNESQPTQN